MATLKQKTVSGLSWSFIDNFSHQGIAFIVGIILARLLSPEKFGLIGLTTVFIVISRTFIDSGFKESLIRKNDCTQEDYSTIFYFNLIVSIFFYGLLFLSSKAIADFFNQPQLKAVLRVLGINIVIYAITMVQRVILIKRIDFKLQTKISIISLTVAGVVAIVLAYTGFGVWSLVVKTLLVAGLSSAMLWFWNKWTPDLVFSRRSFKEHFSFGSKILISRLLNVVHKDIYIIVIAKFFSAAELGFYSRAKKFKELPSSNLTKVIQVVSYPVLASIQDNAAKLKSTYQRLIKSTMLITFPSMLVLAAIAEPLVLTLIGERWLPSVVYLQLLCFVGMFYPLHSLNLNMLNVKGRSDLFLKLEIIKKVTSIPTILIGIKFGIVAMLFGMILKSFFTYYLNSRWSGKFIGYSANEQIKDILPSFLLALSVAVPVYVLGEFLIIQHYLTLILQLLLATILTLGLTELFKMKDYIYIKNIITDKFSSKLNKMINNNV